MFIRVYEHARSVIARGRRAASAHAIGGPETPGTREERVSSRAREVTPHTVTSGGERPKIIAGALVKTKKKTDESDGRTRKRRYNDASTGRPDVSSAKREWAGNENIGCPVRVNACKGRGRV